MESPRAARIDLFRLLNYLINFTSQSFSQSASLFDPLLFSLENDHTTTRTGLASLTSTQLGRGTVEFPRGTLVLGG